MHEIAGRQRRQDRQEVRGSMALASILCACRHTGSEEEARSVRQESIHIREEA